MIILYLLDSQAQAPIALMFLSRLRKQFVTAMALRKKDVKLLNCLKECINVTGVSLTVQWLICKKGSEDRTPHAVPLPFLFYFHSLSPSPYVPYPSLEKSLIPSPCPFPSLFCLLPQPHPLTHPLFPGGPGGEAPGKFFQF